MLNSGGAAYDRIYQAVRAIPGGRVSTYGEIARIAGASGARQVGYALHALDNLSDVPWHRVVNARGIISLPAEHGRVQRQRLEREGVRFGAKGAIDMACFGWVAPVRRR